VPSSNGLAEYNQCHAAIVEDIRKIGDRMAVVLNASANLQKMKQQKLYRYKIDKDGEMLLPKFEDYIGHLNNEVGEVGALPFKHKATYYKALKELVSYNQVAPRTTQQPTTRKQLELMSRIQDEDDKVRVWEKSREMAGNKEITDPIFRRAARECGYDLGETPPSASQILAQIRPLVAALFSAIRGDDEKARIDKTMAQIESLLASRRKVKKAKPTDPKSNQDASKQKLHAKKESGGAVLPMSRPETVPPVAPKNIPPSENSPETPKNSTGDFARTPAGYPLPIVSITCAEIVVRFTSNKHYGDYFRRGVILQMFGLLPSDDHSTWSRKDPPASICQEIAQKIEAANQRIVGERLDGNGL
jgi:hypothetical protein